MRMRKPGATRKPLWAPQLCEMHDVSGVLHCITGKNLPGDWWAFPPQDGWVDAGDGWEVWLSRNEIPPCRPIRKDEIDKGIYVHAPDGSWMPALPIRDQDGNSWTVPMVLMPDGKPTISPKLALGEDGLPEERYTDLQARFIKAARYMLEQISGSDEKDKLVCDMAAMAGILSAGHHISEQAILRSGLLDHHLISRTALAMIGTAVDDDEEG